MDSNSFTCCPWWNGGSLSGSQCDGQSTEGSCRKVPREPLQKPDWCMPVNSRQGAQTLTRLWGNHTNISPGPARSRSFGQSAVVGWRHRSGLAGGSSLHCCSGFTAVLSTQREGKTEGEWFECAALWYLQLRKSLKIKVRVHSFKAAGLSVEDFHSSSTLKTTASVKQNSMEKAIPGAPPCCLRQLLAAKEQLRFFFSVYW